MIAAHMPQDVLSQDIPHRSVLSGVVHVKRLPDPRDVRMLAHRTSPSP
jgi:hypothetical protein